MATDRGHRDLNIDTLNNETNLSIYADHLGLTPQFVKDNADRLNKIEKRVKQSLRNLNEDDPNVVFGTMSQLQNIIQSTYISDNYDLQLHSNTETPSTISGIRPILNEYDNKEDTDIFQFYSDIFSNYRNLIPEYRNIARLIPLVFRCADMKSRDVLAINEITKKAIANVYNPDTIGPVDKTQAELRNDPINMTIEKHILDRYKVENKLIRWFRTSLIEGAKPVVVFPYTDIVEMAKFNIELYSKKYGNFNMKASKSTEAMADLIYEYREDKNRLVPDMSTESFKIFEKDKKGNTVMNMENYSAYRDSVISKYISPKELNEYYECGMEDIHTNIERSATDRMYEIYGSNVINKLDRINKERGKFDDLHAEVKIDGGLSEHFKEQIFNAIRTIDNNVEFYDQNEAAMGVSINNFRRLLEYTAYHEDPKTGIVGYGQKLRKEYRSDTPNKLDQDSLSKFEDDNRNKQKRPASVLDEFIEDFEKNSHSILNDCLIKEYDAEDVIPVIVSGKHVGYYVIEVAPYTGNVESIRKRNNNFTDIFLNLGINNDEAISPASTNTMASMHGNPTWVGGANPIDSGGMGLGGTSGSLTGMGSVGISNLTQFDLTYNGQDALKRNNIMKKIMFRVLDDKLKTRRLEDDETFTEIIMSLIRDGAIVQNNIKIIFIPEKYMCYFTPELDGNGIPQSFMKDCLFTCYERILVDMNNIMSRLTRSGTRDKITINVGKAKNLGYTARSIENALTTRRLNVESPFTSLSRVLKASSLSETVIVPAFDGETLFQYEDLTKVNAVQPDDDLLQKLDNQIVTSLKCPIPMINPYQEEDFASLAASRNAEYRFDIIQLQQSFGEITTKFIKLLIVGSNMYKKIKKDNDEFDLSDVKVVFSPPQMLNMVTANDQFGTVSSYVENIIATVINPDDDTTTTNHVRFLLKQKLYQEMMPGMELDKYIGIAEGLRSGAGANAIDERIDRSTNDQITNTSFQPMIIDGEGNVGEPEDQGIGSGDSAGSW